MIEEVRDLIAKIHYSDRDYVYNDPVNHIEVHGTFPVGEIAAAIHALYLKKGYRINDLCREND